MKLPSELAATEDHIYAVGLVIVEWAIMETAITRCISKLVAYDGSDAPEPQTSIALILANGMEARTSIAVLRTLVRYHFEQDADEFDRLAEKIDKARGKRNWFAHSAYWGSGSKPDKIKITTAKTTNKIKITERELRAKDILSIGVEIHYLFESLILFLESRGLSLISLHDTS